MFKFVIKKAKQKDLNSILKLSHILELDNLENEDKIKYATEAGLVWVAKIADEIVGYCLVELFDEKHAKLPNSIFLSDLFVMEGYRNHGVGRQLVKMALKHKYPEQYTYFSVTHDPTESHLTKFYENFGFKVVGKTEAGNVKMIKAP